ncbi:unnamed protein product [Paramecium sonneborni]|uniref:Uncharacterized protein n=1 Tax=Paramecium sonneborni TaxID=65129 RepID=A0A8S1PGV1_9CILI|nr:unnamed protein product [Paramecium sonneborni]
MEKGNKVKNVVININFDGSIMFWQAQSGKQLHRIIERITKFYVWIQNQMGKFLLPQEKVIRIYDEEKKEIIHKFDSADQQESIHNLSNQFGHLNRVFSLKFLEEFPNTILSCGWDGNLDIWDLRDKRSVGSIQGPHVSGDSIDFRNGQLLTGSYRTNNQLQLWDFGIRCLIKNIKWDDIQTENIKQIVILYWQGVVGNRKQSFLMQMKIMKFVDGFMILKKVCIVLIMGINQINLHLELEKEQFTFVN